MEKINIAELLKDCPQGMELDCTKYSNVYFVGVDYKKEPKIKLKIETCGTWCSELTLDKYGKESSHPNAKCLIFPKGKTTWEGFQRPFKDGDVIYVRDEYSDATFTYVAILKQIEKGECIYSHCFYNYEDAEFNIDDYLYDAYSIRFATEEEKQKLFDAIKANGYRWNFQAKRLEKLIVPIFKKGDKVRVKNGVSEPRIIDDVCDTFYTLVPIGTIDFTDQDRWELAPDKLIKPNFKVGDIIQDVDGYKVEITKVAIDDECYEYISIIAKGIGSISFKYQNEWNLVSNKAVKAKFKVGDRIVQKNGVCVPILISNVGDEFYYTNTESSVGVLPISKQDDWELAPNKFDISTLNSFDKVLVRLTKDGVWNATFFSHYDKEVKWGCYPFVTTSSKSYSMCIPYNEDTKYLTGTKNDCADFYKTWE